MSSKGIIESEDFSKWYNELVLKADLAEHSDVRGCMIIKPYGYAIWENQRSIGFNVQANRTSKCLLPITNSKSYLSMKLLM